MNKRFFPTLLLLSSLTAKDTSRSDWQQQGERWGEPQKLSHKKLTENTTLFGVIDITSVSVEKNLTCYGSASLNDVTVKGVTTMFGSLEARSSHLHDIDVRSSHTQQGEQGTVVLEKVTAKRITACAHLQADDCTFEQITVFAQKLSLKSSRVQHLIVMNSKPVIELIDTVIEGDVTFSTKGGVIICKGTSQIKGSITNGTIA